MQEDLQKLPPGFPRGAVPLPPFPLLAPNMGQMHTLMPTQSLQPTQQLEYKVKTVLVRLGVFNLAIKGLWNASHKLVLGVNINFIDLPPLTSYVCWSIRSSPCCSHLPCSCSMAWGLLVGELLTVEQIFNCTLSSWRGHGGPHHLSPAQWVYSRC